ncbi:histidine kinase [Marinobacter sp. ANT_B65]|uniref:sensor histidine kinase n=1 Tax=Marinobacter sp. ANT_B65 TaxID=2039467 RepID=UPI000BBE0C36|nr:histidine kinase [Marinobacter sp. ANT_B65]PCM44544.1 sensor histidine kinase [Marinobacter sp. ANT_B65]
MTAYRKISLTMLTVFILVYLLGAVFYIGQARHDVQRELIGVHGLADSLGSPGNLPASVVENMRHMRPLAGTASAAKAGDSVPSWFSSMIAGNVSFAPVNGWRIDPSDEAEEIWEGFLLISFSYAVGMVLCFAALYGSVRQGLRPLESLASGLEAVAGGKLTSRLPRQDIRELDALAGRFNTMAVALENEQKTVSLLLNELLQLQDRERSHIARVLHDDLGQYLTGIRAQARSWVYDPELDEQHKQQARDMAGHCETLQQHFRHLLQDLHPLVMEQLGLGSAIRHLTEQWQQLSGLDCRLDMDDRLPQLTDEQQTHLYRFLQEALNNISRHARASCATLAVAGNTQGLRVEIRDDGEGNDNLPEKAGLGLRSMRERARCLGGKVQFFSKAGEGTCICLAVPLPNSGSGSGGAL